MYHTPPQEVISIQQVVMIPNIQHDRWRIIQHIFIVIVELQDLKEDWINIVFNHPGGNLFVLHVPDSDVRIRRPISISRRNILALEDEATDFPGGEPFGRVFPPDGPLLLKVMDHGVFSSDAHL